MTEPEITLPDGMMVERGCIAAAAAVGVVWQKAGPEMRALYRVVVNAALLSWGAGALPVAEKAYAERFGSIAALIRACALEIEPTPGVPEGEIESLFRAATMCEGMAAVIENAEVEGAGEDLIL